MNRTVSAMNQTILQIDRAARRLRLLLPVFATALALVASPAQAAEPTPDNRFQVELGTFFVSTDTTMRVDGEVTQTGTSFDAEQELGFDDANRFRAEAAWRFAPRHRLRAMYFDNDRSNTRRLDEEIEFDDTTFPVGAEVNAQNRTTIIELTYEYSFMQREGWELAGSFGLHQTTFEMSLDADVTAGAGSASRHLAGEAKTEAPLPLIGLRGSWQLAEDWLLNAQVQYFQLEYDAYDGSIADYKVDLVWMFAEHFGVGLGYNQFAFRVDVDEGNFDGRLRWTYGGGLVYFKAAW
jgi:hypothetical protein